MEVDYIYTPKIQTKKCNKLNQVELRIQNDLLEINKNRLSTKFFDVDLSNLFKDEINQFFTLNVFMKEKNNNKNLYNFLIIFDKDYPYSPPFIKLIRNFDNNLKLNFIDELGNIKLKFLSKENWSPILSLNTIVFAMELIIIDPEECSYNMNSLELYRREELFTIASKNNNKLLTNINQSNNCNYINCKDESISRINKNEISLAEKLNQISSINNSNNINRKRKFGEFEESNKNKIINENLNFQVKRFKGLNIDEKNKNIQDRENLNMLIEIEE